MGFDPARLTRDATLNQLVVDGHRGHELLAAWVTVDLDDAELGRRIVRLLATLHDPGTAERQGTTPVRRACLEHWRTVRRVWLGGGQLAGRPDLTLDPDDLAALDLDVRVADHPGLLPLIGAARAATATAGDGRIAVMDCGHTAIKRGVATVAGGTLVRLDVLPRVPAPADNARTAAVVREALETTMAAGADRAGPVSVASYVDGGSAIDSNSVYHRLTLDTELLHDGTAAAMAFTDPTPAGVVLLGSFLGVGFVPQPRPLLPVADGFAPVSAPDRAR